MKLKICFFMFIYNVIYIISFYELIGVVVLLDFFLILIDFEMKKKDG